MYSQSGELVTILKDKFNFKGRTIKSLWFAIWVLLMLVSSIPCFLLKGAILRSYEDRAVAWRSAEIQNQCTILCKQLSTSDYLERPVSEVINSELSMLSSVYCGRSMKIIVLEKTHSQLKQEKLLFHQTLSNVLMGQEQVDMILKLDLSKSQLQLFKK